MFRRKTEQEFQPSSILESRLKRAKQTKEAWGRDVAILHALITISDRLEIVNSKLERLTRRG